MIKATIEMLPLGFETKKKTLGVMIINNIGGTDELGNYRVRLMRADNVLLNDTNVFNYRRSKGWGRLVEEAFSACYPQSQRERLKAKQAEVRDEGVGKVSTTTTGDNPKKSRKNKKETAE